MSQGNRSWVVAVVLALATNVAAAAALNDGDKAPAALSAATLAKFYPTPLASSPVGVIEDQAVWQAKVQGLITASPQWLQQNVLASQTRSEFMANLGLLEQMQKGSMDHGAVALKSLAKDGKVGTKALDANSPLGSGNGDLVYTALPPCRIMDSRTGGGGLSNPLVGNHLYSIPGFTSTNWGLYGGNSGSNCGLTSSVGSNIWAVALVITILNPNFDAYLGVSDSSTLATVLSTVALNYTHGQGLSTVYIVPQISGNTIFFAMPSALTANIIFDVIGYFAVSEATPLDCISTAEVDSTVANGANWSFNATACPSGYTRVEIGCRADFFNSSVFASNGFTPGANADCQATNTFGGSQTMHASSRCCRVPGR
ncbi:MAG: hypothetical protein E6H66_22365 [Betaproteobacteria bacterium]|nr:MAG: hypothetical protein E6H66_22365 [Betaproteobacteria bacterium]